ncbi:MAG: GTP pyrophosphokinase family protein [Oscillospiraceae bacterium]|nr:GTP pyrophosphokinase family protein [Oscillospiraceae bacterium]
MNNSFYSFSENDRKLFEIFFSDNPEATEIRTAMQSFTRLMAYYKCAMMELETKFNVLNEEFSLRHDRTPISAIKTRLKKLDSIIRKLSKKDIPLSLNSLEDNLNDIAGIRIICSFERDVYMLADALLSQDDITLIETKDYIKSPKPNGYRSLHLIVSVPIFLLHEKRSMRVEIQLRTIAMDSWAALEHQLKYKKDINFTEDMANDLYLCSQLSAELDKRMDSLREKVNI